MHNLFSDSNTLNAVTSILFKDSTLYRTIFHVYEGIEGMRENAMQRVMASCRNCQPESFGVKKEYCLEEGSLTSAKMVAKEVKVEGVPYAKCIRKLRQLEDIRTPVGKLKVIVNCADKITVCINEFYKGNRLDSKHSMIDADQVLSIFTYILCMSRVRNIGVHLRIIENFSSSEQLLSVTGYYFSVLLCAAENLLKDEERFLGDETRRSL
jgi:ribosomal protein L37E